MVSDPSGRTIEAWIDLPMRCMCGHASTMCIGAAAMQVVDVSSSLCGRMAGTDPRATSHAATCGGAVSVSPIVTLPGSGGPAAARITCVCTMIPRVAAGIATPTSAGKVNGACPGAQTCMVHDAGIESQATGPAG